MGKLRVGILGATGAVGQNFVRLLNGHPWFEVTYVAASPRSAGKKYQDAITRRFYDTPETQNGLIVRDVADIEDARDQCDLLFSSYEGPSKEDIQKTEEAYAGKLDIPLISNNSALRWVPDVPMIIPEVNPEHAELIKVQRKNYVWKKGLLAVKPNCSIQSFVAPVYALLQAGYRINSLVVDTDQALSGNPDLSAYAMADNVTPYIGGEEEKTEQEPLKIFGKIHDEKIVRNHSLKIRATCKRVPVSNGHMATVIMGFDGKTPPLEDIIDTWNRFRSAPQHFNLPSAPEHPIIYRPEDDRPQTKLDRDAERGMAVSVGRLRKYDDGSVRFVGLSHNTIRGAAGGAILTAELLTEQGYIKRN